MSDKLPEKNQTINVIQTNNGCGCGSFISTVLGAIISLALVIVFLEKSGPIVTSIPGLFLGYWAGVKLGGNNMNTIQIDKCNGMQVSLIFLGTIFGGIGGWIFGAELIKELDDNARILNEIIEPVQD